MLTFSFRSRSTSTAPKPQARAWGQETWISNEQFLLDCLCFFQILVLDAYHFLASFMFPTPSFLFPLRIRLSMSTTRSFVIPDEIHVVVFQFMDSERRSPTHGLAANMMRFCDTSGVVRAIIAGGLSQVRFHIDKAYP